MTLRTRTGRCAAALLTAAVAGGVLTGCQIAGASSLFVSCEGTESRVAELESHAVLGSRPEGAVVPRGFEDLDSGCWEDSGEAHLYADRTYVFPGGRADVIEHYRTAAEQDGWKPSRTAPGSPGANRPEGLCFTLGKGRGAPTLDVYFLTEEILKDEGHRPGPEFASGTGYRVSVGSTADGSTVDCSD
ncbi:hypothetical protein [Streptomyces sp. NPDC057554]|uniref:hypothetical protein n=1 Tax=Streptomyces sp. NPDC057554 TaxID=3350538 RepID=UPI00368A8C93